MDKRWEGLLPPFTRASAVGGVLGGAVWNMCVFGDTLGGVGTGKVSCTAAGVCVRAAGRLRTLGGGRTSLTPHPWDLRAYLSLHRLCAQE